MGWLFARMKHLIIPFSILVNAAAVAADPVEFNRDIRPILTHHCTACHGGVKQAGGISFIMRESALAAGESGLHPIVPGNPAKSEILRRIRSSDPDEVMPQPKHGPPLSVAEASLIERWISEGAKWQNHWSHEVPVEPASPKVSDETWPSSPLDRLVLARLDREKLRPSPEAPAAEWLRRASFDLTGLPPTPEELAAFETAHAADPAVARAQAVDRLLASPHYGERWAAVWLDLARYADTYGFEKDPHRDIWPWRDWVIRAFNEDMPFDQFTIEQLAGDLLPNATADERLATAFHRNTQTNSEGGTDDEEFRVAAVIDRSTPPGPLGRPPLSAACNATRIHTTPSTTASSISSPRFSTARWIAIRMMISRGCQCPRIRRVTPTCSPLGEIAFATHA